MRSLPPFPLYSLAGAIDGGIGGGEDRSRDCGNVGAARAGVGGLPGVLSTKVLILLRYGGVAGVLSISNSGVTALVLPLASLSASGTLQGHHFHLLLLIGQNSNKPARPRSSSYTGVTSRLGSPSISSRVGKLSRCLRPVGQVVTKSLTNLNL